MSRTSESRFRSISHEGGCGKEIAREMDGVLHVEDLRRGCKTWIPLPGWVEVDKLAQLLEELKTGHLNINRLLLGLEVKTFKPGVLGSVKALGGQFETACLTTVPGGESFETQRNSGVIGFRSTWHDNPKEAKSLAVEPSIVSEVIYLTDLVKDTLGRTTYDPVDERKHVQRILESLPKVEGLRWIVGNTPTVNRVLANHLVELLPTVYTWTSDTYEHETYGLGRLIVGYFRDGQVHVNVLEPSDSYHDVGLFVLGVPA